MATSALQGRDIHGPVDYYLDYMSSPSFDVGGSDSGWQASRSYTDSFLAPNGEYCYRAWARDNAVGQNLTSPSTILCTYTSQETPAGISFGALGGGPARVPALGPVGLAILSGLLLAAAWWPPRRRVPRAGLRRRAPTARDGRCRPG